ncbi:MAG TPA: hypothetical protein VE982_05420 [Gaiellaceae bacterium]|nr:hypothetical protein [Gaiellaceae bacterium]
MIVRALLLALALAAPVHAAAAAPTRAGLTVWPARIRLAAGATSTIHVTNGSRRTQVVEAGVAGFVLDLRGDPRIVRVSAGTRLLALRPARLVLRPGTEASFLVGATRPRGVAPGDHPALVVLTARSPGGSGVGVRVRIGVSVEVRVPGTVRRRLEVRTLRVRRRVLELVVANRGNVAERIAHGAVVLRLFRRGRLVAVLRPRPRDLLPQTRGVLEFAVPQQVRGRVSAAVVVRAGAAETRRFEVAV